MAQPVLSGEELVQQTIQQNPVCRGLAVVVACQHSYVFTHQDDILYGVINDSQQTCSVFEHLHYAVVPLPNPTKQYIIDVVTAVAQLFPECAEDDPRYKRIVFSFSGHGDEGGIHTADGGINVQSEIMWPLLPENCPHLRHIPKLFFIDACRGGDVDRPIPRGPTHQFVYHRVSGLANYLLVQSTLPSMKAFETGCHQGGYWTQMFVAELRKPSNYGKDIGYILIEVNRQVNMMFNIPALLNMPNRDYIQQAISENTLLDHVLFLDEAHLFGEISPDHFTEGSPVWSGGEPSSLGGQSAAPVVPMSTQQVELSPQSTLQAQHTSAGCSSTQGYVQRGPISHTPVTSRESPSTVAAATPTPSSATPTSTLSPVAELERRLRESHGDSVVIDWQFSEAGGGHRATVLAPVVGYVRGDVCTSRSKAKKSAAAEALKALG